MVDFILFILLIITAFYGYSTRQKLIAMASSIDSINILINQAIADDHTRLEKIEKKLNKSSRI